VSVLDLLFILLAVAAVVGGYRLGFVTRVVSWIGLALGLVVAVRLLPWFLDLLDTTSQGLVLALVIGLLLVGASLGQALGFVVGGRLRPRRSDGVFGASDRVLGGLAGFVGLVVLVWLILPVLVASPGWISRQATTSWVAQTIDSALPQPPDAMQTLQSLVGDDAFPDVFDALRPTPDLGPPPAASGLDEATAERVARSVVKIEGVACSRVQDGTGFVVADGLVVTNAHVVAGEPDTDVIRDDGRHFAGTVVAFDPDRDLALVAVEGFDRPPLPVSPTTAAPDAVGGVFGHPGGEPLRIAPYRVARSLTATGRDIYGNGETERQVLELAASLRPGDSGSPIVAPDGTVAGVAFAISRDRADVAYALAPSELQAVLAARQPVGVDTGGCLT
jgi:S1-C subfamily serine protease